LSPRASIASGDGPIQTRPAPITARAKLGVLGEEAVAGVHGVGAGAAGDREDLLDRQVRLGARRAFEGVRLVGELRVHGVAVLVGVDGDRALSGVAGGADHADGDLAAVRDEHLGDRAVARPGATVWGGHGSGMDASLLSTPRPFGSLAQDPCENVVRTYEASGSTDRSTGCRAPRTGVAASTATSRRPSRVALDPLDEGAAEAVDGECPATCRGSPVPT
jgi:hypothetical protein